MVDLAERKPNVRRYTWQDRRKPLSERLEERLEKSLVEKNSQPQERLKSAIEELAITQSAFAEAIHLSRSGLSGILSGRTQLQATTALAIEYVHGISANWLLNGTLPKVAEGFKDKEKMRFCESCQTHKPNTKVFFNDFKACKLCQRIAHATERRHRLKDSAPVPATSR